MTVMLAAEELALAWRLPPLADTARLAGAVPVPADLCFTLDHLMIGWCGRTLAMTHRFSSGRLDTELLVGEPVGELLVRTRFVDYLDWREGRISTLELLAGGGSFELRRWWTDLLVAHGLVQLGIQARLDRLEPLPRGFRAWAESVATVGEVRLEELLADCPWNS